MENYKGWVLFSESYCVVADKLLDCGACWPNVLWSEAAPSTVQLFCCLAFGACIVTRDLLIKTKVLPVNANDFCVLCGSCKETVDHLMVQCFESCYV